MRGDSRQYLPTLQQKPQTRPSSVGNQPRKKMHDEPLPLLREHHEHTGREVGTRSRPGGQRHQGGSFTCPRPLRPTCSSSLTCSSPFSCLPQDSFCQDALLWRVILTADWAPTRKRLSLSLCCVLKANNCMTHLHSRSQRRTFRFHLCNSCLAPSPHQGGWEGAGLNLGCKKSRTPASSRGCEGSQAGGHSECAAETHI